MERSDPRYQAYVEILKEELIPAMGCTEPIALAYAAARAREVLGALPESVQLQVSGSIIKNVKSVIVPNTGHLKGMEAAVAAGIIAGSAEKELEVISEVSEDKKAAIRDYLQTVPISIQHIEQGHVFDIIVTERSGDSYAKVRIADFHTNICLIEKNGRVLYEKPLLKEEARRDSRVDRSLLNMKDIWDFAETADHTHHIGRCDDDIKAEPVFLGDLVNEILTANEISTSCLSSFILIFLAEYANPYSLTSAVRQYNCTTNLLVSVSGVNAQTDMSFYSFIKLCLSVFANQTQCFFRSILLAGIYSLAAVNILFSVFH